MANVSENTENPEPNQVWYTKSGRYVLIVIGGNGDLGFIWLDELDKTLSYSPLLNQLNYKTPYSVSEWGIMMNEYVRES